MLASVSDNGVVSPVLDATGDPSFEADLRGHPLPPSVHQRDWEADLELHLCTEGDEAGVLGDFEAPDVVRRGNRHLDDNHAVNGIPTVRIDLRWCGRRVGRLKASLRRVVLLASGELAWSLSDGHTAESILERLGRVGEGHLR